MSNANQLETSIIIEEGQAVTVGESIIAPIGQPAIDIPSNNAQLEIVSPAEITALDEGNTAVQSLGNNVSILNSGTIRGDLNGISSDSNDFSLDNQGIITSNSRAVQIGDGDGVNLTNAGGIFGTGDQRDGTVYLDGSVDNANITNQHSGIIDAGEGNSGDGLSIQVGIDSEDALNQNINIVNDGSILGRGEAEFSPEEGRLTPNGSSGVRFFNGSDAPSATLTGSITNNNLISAEVNTGFLGGFVSEDGVAIEGEINNNGLITAPRNGLYIGNAQHNLTINNAGRIESGSRALNLDGDQITFNNTGEVVGIGSQRDGTLYVDGTGDGITINNQHSGIIDAQEGNSGSGVSVQVGTANGIEEGVDDLEASVNIVNEGLIQGRGTENVPAGVRLFVGDGLTESTFTGDISNSGTIAAENQAGILIEPNVTFNGVIVNDGTISGGNGLALDADGALGSINVTNNGTLEGRVRLGTGNDIFTQNSDEAVRVEGGAGSDTLIGGAGNDILQGGGGSDITDGGDGIDTADFGDIGFGVTADLSTGEATYSSGFTLTVDDAALLDQRDPDVLAPESIVDELSAGNGYINVHTEDNPNGEIRGQLGLIDNTDGILRYEGVVEGSQEVITNDDGEFVPAPVDTPASGLGVLTVDTNTGTYDFDLSVSNLDPNDLLPVPVGGPTPDSPVHIHNAPAGQNGPIPLNVGDPGISTVTPTVVTDSLISIENLTGSLNDDLLTGDHNANVLVGSEGDDTLTGGDGHDVFSFGTGFGADTITDFEIADTLDFGAYSDDVNQILGAATQNGNDIFIDLGSDSLTLENFAVSDLTNDNILV